MAEPTITDTVFVSTISLLRVLQGFDKQFRDIRELQCQIQALSTVLLLLNGMDHMDKLNDELNHLLLQCGEGCDSLKELIYASTSRDENLNYWECIYHNTTYMLSAYTSTFIIGFAGEIL